MEVGGKNIFHLWLKKWDGLGKQNKMLGETYLTTKNTTTKILLIKKARLRSCLFVCFPVKNQWILAPMDLTFMFSAPGFGWDPKADRADLPHIVEVLVPPQRSTDVPSPRWLGAPKINSSPLKIGNPKKGKANLSPKHQFSVPSFGGGGYGLFLRGRMEDGGWRYVDQNEREQPFFLGYCIFCYELTLGGLGGDHFQKTFLGWIYLSQKFHQKPLRCNAWKYQRGREIRNSHEHLFLVDSNVSQEFL